MVKFPGFRILFKNIRTKRRWKNDLKQMQTYTNRSEMRKQFERLIEKDLYGPATAIIKKFNLHQSPRSKSVLTTELQKTFLESLKRDKGKLTRREKKCLDLVTRVQAVQLTLWVYQGNKKTIPIEKALLINRVAVELMKKAEKSAKGNMEEKKHFQRIEAKAKEKVKELLSKRKKGRENSLDAEMQQNLWIATEIGDSLIESAVDSLPEFSQAGFTAVEKTVKIAFGVKTK